MYGPRMQLAARAANHTRPKENTMRNVLAIRMSMAICTSLLILTGCGGGGSPSVGQTKFDRVLPVPGVGAGTNFSFDIADVDTRTNRLYFTDRNNKSVDVYDTRSNT